MDVSPDYSNSDTAASSEDKDASVAAVRLPFSMVPGMDISSRSYIKAITILGKQQTETLENKSLTEFSDQGNHFIAYLFLFSILNNLFRSLSVPIGT
jgi:hypothetical protein